MASSDERRGEQQPGILRRNHWPKELAGAITAVLLAIIVVSHLVTTDRAALLYSDGDSLVNVLVVHSEAPSPHTAPSAFSRCSRVQAQETALNSRRSSRPRPTTAQAFPRLVIVAAAAEPDASVACVTQWVEESGRTGAGQFWAVRAPKAYLDDPRQLVQVDHRLNGYAWLVNRSDFEPGAVSFLVADEQSYPFVLPADASTDDAAQISCGRYPIIDFGTTTLPIGPLRS